MSSREEYNLITDTVTGPNVRLKDNLYQGFVILACLLLGGVVGFAVPSEARWVTVGIAAFVGLFVGLIGSGIFIMIYRAVKHVKGKHE